MRHLILADNQAITRFGVKYLVLEAGRKLSLIKEAVGLQELSMMLSSYPDSVVVIDYTLFDCTADQLWILKERFPQSVFVLFSDALSESFIRRMVLGSIQFSLLFKDSEVHEITACLDEAEQGRQYICMKAKGWLYEKERNTVSDIPQLTITEKEVLRSLALGKTTKEIAAERFLSVYTVMTHRKNIFRKLNVNNAQEAIRYALRAGIVNVAEYCI